ncbi:folate-binding protein [Betaproteobacteria bacterium]|nr:folate-binding protein [Betaproteobacteria bacterium]GHU21533.1 folate-binding protein [Betaproteobacteria bacterium]
MTTWIDALPTAHTAAAAAAPTANSAALTHGAVAVPLLHLGLLHAEGEDAKTFLHNLLSNDVAKLPADGAQWTSFNTPKGRMLASFLLWPDDTGYSLALAADITPALLEKLQRYILRSKVKLTDASATRALIGLIGPQAAATLEKVGLPRPATLLHQATNDGVRVLHLSADTCLLDLAVDRAADIFTALTQAGAQAASSASWQLAMIRAGIPLITAATQEAFVAQMLNYELIGGVSFKKGCYPGQEIIARAQHIGEVKRRLYRLAFSTATADALAPGAELVSGQDSVGTVVNAALLPDGSGEALAVIHKSCVNAGNEIFLGSPDGSRASVLDLPYALP